MELKAFRKSLGLSQEACARALGLTSKGQISDFERRKRAPSLGVALRIERWSGGKIPAASLNVEAAELAQIKPVRAA